MCLVIKYQRAPRMIKYGGSYDIFLKSFFLQGWAGVVPPEGGPAAQQPTDRYCTPGLLPDTQKNKPLGMSDLSSIRASLWRRRARRQPSAFAQNYILRAHSTLFLITRVHRHSQNNSYNKESARRRALRRDHARRTSRATYGKF